MKRCYCKNFILNGYLTIFLSLLLTLLLSIIWGLIDGAMQNLGKLKFECAADIAMNSVLSEFHQELLEQYDLLFVDISYGSSHGLITNMEEHAKEYMNKNLHASEQEIIAWNEPDLKKVSITEDVMATDLGGTIMRQQACAYMIESGVEDSFTGLRKSSAAAQELDMVNGMELWKQVMHQIDGISRPLFGDENGGWKEAALDNPAEAVFHTAEERLNSLYYAQERTGKGVIITSERYLSKRGLDTPKGIYFGKGKENERYLFQAYLFNKCGFYKMKKQGSLLDFQIEYIIFGENSDQKNLAAVIERIFKWKFADYIRLYFNNDSEYDEAEAIAGSLYPVNQNQKLREPVAHSILYAQAFLDSIHDTELILQGEKVPLYKESLDDIKKGQDYRQYLWLMLNLESDESVNLRAMDIMEMDIRQTAYNHNFRMDWCIESYHVQVTGEDQLGNTLEINRRYGYY